MMSLTCKDAAVAWTAAALCMAAFALPATAQAQEQLYLEPPPGWEKAYDTRQGTAEIRQFVPEGQNLDDWSDMVVVQVMHGLSTMPPDLFLASVPGQLEKYCEEPRFGDIQKGLMAQQEAAFQIVQCPLNTLTGRGELSMFLVIKGQSNLYALQRAWQTPSYLGEDAPIPQAAMDAGIAYLRAAKLCSSLPCR
ncbi:hypothetical protein [Telmatospirillum sp. J64-1]|uniref:hypothetical protein n=1 Tax=Telmatospirillum sp. J64-1 TaxID=2502183 RepID=UPI00115EE1B6|nr:hypothetical protein [Telmatospirillum sp. J64-1]